MVLTVTTEATWKSEKPI